jgi:hypothetical protein
VCHHYHGLQCALFANAFAERWVRSVKEECLSKLILFGEASLRRVGAASRNFELISESPRFLYYRENARHCPGERAKTSKAMGAPDALGAIAKGLAIECQREYLLNRHSRAARGRLPALERGFSMRSIFVLTFLASSVVVFAQSDRGTITGTIGIGVFASSPVLAFACMIMAVTGPLASDGPFWQIPPILLAGSAAAGGIALINSIGALSGLVGPSVFGWLEDVTGKTTAGLYVVAGLEILGSALMLLSFHAGRSRQNHRGADRNERVPAAKIRKRSTRSYNAHTAS